MKKQVLVTVDRGRDPRRDAGGVRRPGAPPKPPRQAAPPQAPTRSRPGYRVAEIYFERRGGRSIVGNIYKGRVDNVLPGLEAAFVDIGLDKNGFLHVDEIVLPGVEQAKRGARQTGRASPTCSSPGQEIVVQVVKDPLKTKGARLSMELTIAGRYMVYAPTGEGVGVSRRLEDKERDRLRKEAKQLDLRRRRRDHPHRGPRRQARGLRARAAVPVQAQRGARRSASRTRQAPALVFQEADLSVRVVRDIFSDALRDARSSTTRSSTTGWSRSSRAPRPSWSTASSSTRTTRAAVRGLRRRAGDRRACSSAASTCPSGGYLIIDYAEALTVIDVNTGSFTGKGKSARLEDTITKTNLEAADEVVRQLRLRDIGGIIVIDFIDMARSRNRDAVLKVAAQGARRGPHEDLRGRDLAARPGRDDAPERHRRRARDHDQAVPGVPRRGRREVRGDDRDRDRAPPAPHGRARPATDGPRPTCCGSTRGSAAWFIADGARELHALEARDRQVLPLRGLRGPAARPLRGDRWRASREEIEEHAVPFRAGRGGPRRTSSSRTCTTTTTPWPRSTAT